MSKVGFGRAKADFAGFINFCISSTCYSGISKDQDDLIDLSYL
jgi:hypothetical protein